MTRRRILSCLVLITLTLAPLWGIGYGASFHVGQSRGSGAEWNDALNQAGNREFSKSLPSAGIGAFLELPVSDTLLFIPELAYAFNRGGAMKDGQGNSVETTAPHSLELLLPFGYDFPFASGSRAFRVSGGFQFLYSFGLKQSVKMGENEQPPAAWKHLSPFSMGFVLGSGVEFRREKKVSWLVDIRLIIPASDRIRYALPDGSEKSFKTMELLFGSGIKF